MADLVKWSVNGIFNADANKCYSEILELEKITPAEVLERARDEKSELHKCFEWDNNVAAEKYRTFQAGQVIRMLYIVPKDEETPQVRVLSRTSHTVYQPTRSFLTNEKWKYKNVNHILLGVNYDKDLISGDDAELNHVVRGHMSIDTACDFVKANYLDGLQNVIMCHLSAENADKATFIEKMQKVVPNVNVCVAEPGMKLELRNPGVCPF
jgi:hypothetical protein